MPKRFVVGDPVVLDEQTPPELCAAILGPGWREFLFRDGFVPPAQVLRDGKPIIVTGVDRAAGIITLSTDQRVEVANG